MNDKEIRFTIWNFGDMCRIEANDCRSDIRNISDGACITDINVLMHEINYISDQCAERGYNAVFVNEGKTA